MAGRPPDVSDAEILRAVKLTYGPATAGEVANQTGINNSAANKRLSNLVGRDLVNEKKVGARAKVYWLTDEGEQYI